MTPNATIEVIDPGLQTTVQAWPGRIGFAALGYSPAGPMDHVSFRAANVLVGNPGGAPALEVPMVEFSCVLLRRARLAVTGPDQARLTVNEVEVPTWQTFDGNEGDEVRISRAGDIGFRAYVAVAGGLDVPAVFGSAATALVTDTGGVQGRALVRGDQLGVADARATNGHRRLPEELRPRYTTDWEVEVLPGPHAVPDHLTVEDWDELLATTWRVDLNSDRIATRLHPHRFRWARADGGPAGGHPSNMLDTPYPAGGVLANGDVLTILGADSYTSGGFAVVATVPHCAIWKLGQVRPGRDTIRFREVTYDEAVALDQKVEFGLAPTRAVPT